MAHIIKYYPVGSADCSLVKLSNGKTIIIDCQITEVQKDKNGKETSFNVKKDILSLLPKKDGHPFVDLYISTHPHDDHCIGFGGNFYHGDPKDYDNEKNKDQIIIGELWITPRGIGNNLAASAEDIRKEAKRRRSLYDDSSTFKGSFGNYLRIIGYDKDKEFDSRYGYIPGTLVTNANGTALNWLEIFIHAPFKEEVIDSKVTDDKNETSIVTQFAFKVDGEEGIKCRAIFGGDAEHGVWQHILDNNQNEEKLQWNIFLAPHHCSWTFFNECSNKDEVLPSADDMMNKQIGSGAHIIASSTIITKDCNTPPHIEAKQEYKKRIKNTSNFYCTADTNVKDGIAYPIEYHIDKNGKTLKSLVVPAGVESVSRPAPRAGKE